MLSEKSICTFRIVFVYTHPWKEIGYEWLLKCINDITGTRHSFATFCCGLRLSEGVCRPGQTSVLPPPLIISVLQSGYFSGFRTSGVWTNPWGFPRLLSPHFLPRPSHSPISNPTHPFEEGLGSAVSFFKVAGTGGPAEIKFGVS